MKNLIITFSLLFCIGGTNAQITLEHTYDTGTIGSGGYSLRPFHFSSHGYMYVMVNPDNLNGMVEIYNLNHTLYKQFAIPPQPLANSSLSVNYVSDSLLNTNSSNFEYLVQYIDAVGTGHVRIYDDMGNTVFSKDSVYTSGDGGLGGPMEFPYIEPIFYTSNGYKLIFIDDYGFTIGLKAYVYSLPGALPCDECSNGVLLSSVAPNGQQNNGGSLLNAYPNPAKNSTTIKYELPTGVNQGQLIFYDLQGRQVKSFTVDRTFDSLLVSTADLASGTYFYILKAGSNYVGSKKMVIIK